ncbi:hypothetical protein BUALT_Bualt04G0051500 [Buddleja alternifolia]|uniref:Myb/SANT-like domain-containing protein n=1 Tax=Buddleja alternifolia TaxID=168488 RepID=A0AAV6XSZ4_9LAMI|nr:hypothetical protein BUALT_Bualt04G0051500 [Buddleja alternifolia]
MSQGTQGRSSARWDSFANIKFIELCEEEIGKGNRSNSHFNRNGWNNLLKRFNEMTGRNYAYKQFRNHWDSMKKDWILFKKLMHQESGIGRDPINNTIDAYVAATGERARAPSQRSANELDSGEEMFEQNFESTEDQREHVEIGDSDDMEDIGSPNQNIASGSRQAHYTSEMFPPSTTIKRKSSDENSKMKKKMFGAASLREDIHSLLQFLATKSSSTSTSSVEMTINAAIEMLSSIPGRTPRSELWNYACNRLSKKAMGEVDSGETISRHFHRVLKAIGKLAGDVIKPHPKYNDGEVVDLNMCFTFAWVGWEGAAHDNRIFGEAIRRQDLNFPYPKGKKIYLVDAGYSHKLGYIGPYKVWKTRWNILADMPYYHIDTQREIVLATMAIHNYIRKKNVGDHAFRIAEDESYEPGIECDTEAFARGVHSESENDQNNTYWMLLRDSIAIDISQRGR